MKIIKTIIVIIFLLLALPYLFMYGINLVSNGIGYNYLFNYRQAIIIYYGIIIIKISLLSFYKNKK